MNSGNRQSENQEPPGTGGTGIEQGRNEQPATGAIKKGSPPDDYQEKYRTLSGNIASGVFFRRRDGSLSDANPAAIKMLGLIPGRFSGDDPVDPRCKVISETGEPLARDQYPSIIALMTGKPVRERVVGVCNPGNNDPVWLRTTAIPIFRPGEVTPCQVMVTMDDVSDLKRTNDSLAEREEKFRGLFTHMFAGVAIYEAVGDGTDFIFSDFNPSAETIDGIKKSEVLGKRVSEVFPGVIEFGLFEVLQRVWETGVAEYFPAALYRDSREPGTWRENWVYKLSNGEVVAIYRNITRRKRAEEALLESEEKYHTIFDNAVMGIYQVSMNGTFLSANNYAARILGYESAEELIESITDITTQIYRDPETRELSRKILEETGVLENFEAPCRHKDGHTVWVSFNARLVRDADGNIMYHEGTSQDITERKQAEEALRESEEKYRTLVENIQDGIYTLDCQGNFQFVNDEIIHRSGYSKEWFIGKNYLEVISQEYHKDAQRYFDIVMAGRIPPVYEVAYLTASGALFYVELKTAPIFKNNKVVGLLGISRDINERKQVEEALVLSKKQLTMALEGANADNWDLNLLTGELHFSEQFASRFGDYTPGEIPPTIAEVTALIHTDDWAVTRQKLQQYIDGRTEAYESVFRIKTKAGNWLWVLSRGRIIEWDKSGRPVRIIGVNVDITGHKQAEKQISLALEEKEVLLREIHHRVKNNLARVISLIGLQIAQLTDADDISRFRDLESRIRSMSLVHESLYSSRSFSRINAQTYVDGLVQNLIQSYGPRPEIRWNIGMENISLPIDTAINCGLIITEILTNSLKYAFPEDWSCREERGENCEITVSMKEEEGYIILKVSDNGRGIPQGTTVPGPGSLGLTLIRILVKNQLHGELEMDTKRGASFVVRFIQEPETEGEFNAG